MLARVVQLPSPARLKHPLPTPAARAASRGWSMLYSPPLLLSDTLSILNYQWGQGILTTFLSKKSRTDPTRHARFDQTREQPWSVLRYVVSNITCIYTGNRNDARMRCVTSTHRQNQVHGHRTGSTHSGVDECPFEKTKTGVVPDITLVSGLTLSLILGGSFDGATNLRLLLSTPA